MKIDKNLYNKIIDLYPKWKFLNYEIKKIYSRGINLHEAFTEIICCYHFDFDLNVGKGTSSADAISNKGEKVQIKGSSDCTKDLSSYGPKSEFDILYYCCIDNENQYEMKIYKIPASSFKKIMVNKDESFKQQQDQNRRPRFSIYKKFILPNNLVPKIVVNLKQKV